MQLHVPANNNVTVIQSTTRPLPGHPDYVALKNFPHQLGESDSPPLILVCPCNSHSLVVFISPDLKQPISQTEDCYVDNMLTWKFRVSKVFQQSNNCQGRV